MVLEPIEGSPADRAGIRAGDAIVSIDGNDPGVEPLDKLVKRLRGAPGSHVKVGVRRDTEAAILSFDLVREIVHVQSVSSKLLADRVAYVRIKQFQERTHDELLAAAAKLRGRAARSPRSRASSSSTSTRRARRSSWRARCRITSGRASSASPRSARAACS